MKEILPAGESISVSGDLLVIGATGTPRSERGGFFRILNRRGGSWVESDFVFEGGFVFEAGLGSAVAVDGESIWVSAPGAVKLGDSSASGLVIHYELEAGEWVNRPYNFGEVYSTFGSNIVISGNTRAISAPTYSRPPDGFPAGAVYVSTRGVDGEWVSEYLPDRPLRHVLAPPTPTELLGDRFGTGLDVADDRIIVGGPLEDSVATGVISNRSADGDGTIDDGSDFGAPNSGAAFIYERQDGEWVEMAYLKAFNTAEDRFFGSDVAISGDHAAVADIDSVQTFHFDGSQWHANGVFLDPIGSSDPNGVLTTPSQVEIDGDTMVVGPDIYQYDPAMEEWQLHQTVAGAREPQLISGEEIYYPGMILTKAPRRVYVNHVAAPGGDGRSWANALPYLQDALANARAEPVNVGEIWLAGGIYFPDDGAAQVQGDEAASFNLPDGLVIRGGFQGNELEFTERLTGAVPTVLSGDIDHNDADPDGDGIREMASDIAGANADHVVKVQNTSATLDGVVITAGQADGDGGDDETRGGAIWVTDGGLTIRSCSLRGNSAVGDGGGLFSQRTTLYLTSCELSGNRSDDDGGAIYSWDGDCRITSCRLSGNLAGDRAGAIYLTGVNGRLFSSLLSGNVALNQGGGIYVKRSSDFGIYFATIADNYASTSGGGVFIEPGVGEEETSIVELDSSVIWGNSTELGTEVPAASHNGYDVAFTTGFFAMNLIQSPVQSQASPGFIAPVEASSVPQAGGDYHFPLYSRLVDSASDPADVTLFSEFDLDGEARKRGNFYDLGAYETFACAEQFIDNVFPELPPEGDANGNGLTNIVEFEMGLDPRRPNWDPPLEVTVVTGEPRFRLEYFTYTMRSALASKIQLEAATSLAGPWGSIEESLPDGSYSRYWVGGIYSPYRSPCVRLLRVDIDRVVGERMFFRLKLKPPS